MNNNREKEKSLWTKWLIIIMLGTSLMCVGFCGLAVYQLLRTVRPLSDNPKFEIEYTGAIDGSFEGEGKYLICDRTAHGFVHSVEFAGDGDDYVIIYLSPDLGEGLYPYATPETHLIPPHTEYYAVDGRIAEANISFPEGNLTITNLTSRKIAGNFELEYRVEEDEDLKTVKINGKFEAYNETGGSFDCGKPKLRF